MKISAVMGQGPLVIKIAGIVGGVGLYREGVETAAAAGFRVAMLDTAGDRRDDPAPGPITWDFLAEEVFRALEALGEDRALLWGTSFGCLVALAAAARRPERVRGLLLGHPPDLESIPALYIRLLQWAAGKPDAVRTTRRLFGLGFPMIVGWEFAAPAAMWRLPTIARAAADAATPASTLAQKAALLWSGGPGLPPPQARIPVSLVSSPLDFAAPLRGARRLAGVLPGSRLRVLGMTGHSGHYSRPRSFARLVVEELRRLDDQASARAVD